MDIIKEINNNIEQYKSKKLQDPKYICVNTKIFNEIKYKCKLVDFWI